MSQEYTTGATDWISICRLLPFNGVAFDLSINEGNDRSGWVLQVGEYMTNMGTYTDFQFRRVESYIKECDSVSTKA